VTMIDPALEDDRADYAMRLIRAPSISAAHYCETAFASGLAHSSRDVALCAAPRTRS
jgi:hypothetical protein